jgi:16S rRNA processing protein RimM
VQDAAEPSFPADAVEVGRIAGAWGVKGWFRVEPFSSDPQALFSSRRWFLKPAQSVLPAPPSVAAARSARPGDASESCAPLPVLLRITQAREHGDGVVAAAHDIDDRQAAQSLRGARVFVSRSSFPTAGDGEYYWVDLIGLNVVNRADEKLGSVVGLLETGAHCVLRVHGDGAAERLIPFVAAYVDEVDLAQRRIRVDWGADY